MHRAAIDYRPVSDQARAEPRLRDPTTRGFIIFQTDGRDVHAMTSAYGSLIDRHSEIAAAVIESRSPIRRRLRRHISHPSHNSGPSVTFVNLLLAADSGCDCLMAVSASRRSPPSLRRALRNYRVIITFIRFISLRCSFSVETYPSPPPRLRTSWIRHTSSVIYYRLRARAPPGEIRFSAKSEKVTKYNARNA